eukprot:950615-Rhodomonas_salina.2
MLFWQQRCPISPGLSSRLSLSFAPPSLPILLQPHTGRSYAASVCSANGYEELVHCLRKERETKVSRILISDTESWTTGRYSYHAGVDG